MARRSGRSWNAPPLISTIGSSEHMARNAAGPRHPDRLPVMPMRSTIVFPLGVLGVQIGMRPTLEMLAENPAESLIVAAVIARGGMDVPMEPTAFRRGGVAARLSDRLNLPGGTVQATIQGLHRILLVSVEEAHGFVARVEPAVETPVEEDVA